MHLRSEIVEETIGSFAIEEHAGQRCKTNFFNRMSHEDVRFDLEYRVCAGSSRKRIRPGDALAIHRGRGVLGGPPSPWGRCGQQRGRWGCAAGGAAQNGLCSSYPLNRSIGLVWRASRAYLIAPTVKPAINLSRKRLYTKAIGTLVIRAAAINEPQ
jgi:hypothetical protein